MKDFQQIWNYASNIYGWLTEDEGLALYLYTMSLRPSDVVVEIGSAGGKSSSILAYSPAQVYCIDPFYTILDAKGKERNIDCAEIFIKTIRDAGLKCSLMIMTSQEASTIFSKKIDFLFIDGDHSEKAVRRDCDMWLPKVEKGKHIFFHDYGRHFPGVKKAVDDRKDIRILRTIDRIAVTVKL